MRHAFLAGSRVEAYRVLQPVATRSRNDTTESLNQFADLRVDARKMSSGAPPNSNFSSDKLRKFGGRNCLHLSFTTAPAIRSLQMLHATNYVERTSEQRAKSSVEPIALSDVASTEVRSVAAAWQKWRGLHALPPFDNFDPRDLGRFFDNVSLVGVENDGDDYEFLTIGAAHVQAYGSSYVGSRLRVLIAVAPQFGKLLKASYDLVRTTGRPYAFRGAVGSDAPEARFSGFETCYLPIGESQGAVSHIINAASYTLRDRSALS
jgi:hypothetical protein